MGQGRLRLIGLVAVMVFVAGFLGGGTMAAKGGPPTETPPAQVEDIQRVRDAIAGLSSMDYVVVRRSIRELDGLLTAPSIRTAIRPLSALLHNNAGYHDVLSRGMAAMVLARVAVALGQPQGAEAMDVVIDELSGGDSDFVRASCARALGIHGWENAYDPLVLAESSDTSPLVKSLACEALLSITQGSYSSETCGYDEEPAPASMSMSPSRSITAPSSVPSHEQAYLDWLRTHVLLPVESYYPFLVPAEEEEGSQP